MSEAENEGTPTEAAPEKPQTSRLARASLWFGIIGLVVAVFPAAVVAGMLIESSTRPLRGIAGAMATQLLAFLPAIAFGWLALRRIGRSSGTLRGRGSAVAGIVLAFLGLAVAGLWANTIIGALEEANRAACRSNVIQISHACLRFAKAHDGTMPDSLATLCKEDPYLTNMLWCPSTGHWDPAPENVDAQADYIYAGAGHHIHEAEPSTIPILWDRPGNHGGKGGNVAYLDGHVQWREEVPAFVASERAR
ncbi:MAG: DUF4190 domain-containing protein [Phycisphaerae bacterium]